MAGGYESVSQNEDGKSGSGMGMIGYCLCGCCCCCACLLWGLIPFVIGGVVGYGAFIQKNETAVFEYLGQDPKTIPEYIWYPGCTEYVTKSASYLEKCSLPCYSPDLIPAIMKFNKENDFKEVTYHSREDGELGELGKPVELRGWWLPASPKAPRVVMSHGFTSNANKWYPTLHSYYLRSLGFSVLINNLRDHGSSANTSDVISWGNVYHQDLLGAWDYAVNDPDGVLGGALPKSKVGLMGFSMGGFVALNAFLEEKNVPAVWADSPPSAPADVFFFGASQMAVVSQLMMIPGIQSLTWYWMTSKAGIDIERVTPLKGIPNGPDGKRPVQIVTNLKDKTVPGDVVKKVVAELGKYPDKYATEEPFYTDKMCDEHDHLVAGLLEPTIYRKKLCSFWTDAFGGDKTTCGLESLPKFTTPELEKVETSRRLVSEMINEDSTITV